MSLPESGNTNVDAAVDSIVSQSPVRVEYPTTGGNEIFEKYPNVSKEAFGLRTSVHQSVAISDDWVAIVDSTGQQLACEGSAARTYREAPKSLRAACENQLDRLCENDTDDPDLSDEEIAQLEALGYL